MSEPQRYRKKPVEIEAMQHVDPESAEQIARWITDNGGEAHAERMTHGHSAIYIQTMEGVMLAGRGDFVIRGVKGEFYPCKPDIFAATYDEVKPTQPN